MVYLFTPISKGVITHDGPWTKHLNVSSMERKRTWSNNSAVSLKEDKSDDESEVWKRKQF